MGSSRLRCLAAASAAAFLLPGAASAVTVLPPPLITITATGSDLAGGIAVTTVPLVADVTGLVWSLSSDWHWSMPSVDPAHLGTNAFSITLCAGPGGGGLCGTAPAGIGTILDQDPFITYRGGVQDVGAPTAFGFIFSQGIVATPAPGVASHDQSSSTTDGGNNGVAVTALPPPAGIPVDGNNGNEIYVFTLSTNGGVTLLNAGLDLRQTFTAGSQSQFQAGLDETGPGPAASGLYNFMRVDVNFQMAGANDIITFNGKADVVPEPATAAMLALGLIGLGVLGRRQERS